MEKYILLFGAGIIVAGVLFLTIWQVRKKRMASEKHSPEILPSASVQNELQFSPRPQSLPPGDNVNLQLAILRQTLDLTTVILLWAGPEDKNVQILGMASCLRNEEINREPFPQKSGILAGLGEDCQRIAVSPVPADLPVPYYATARKTGRFLAQSIPVTAEPGNTEKKRMEALAILCLDSEKRSPWTEQEQKIVNLTCRKLSHDLYFSNKLEETNRHMEAIHQIYMSMLELNQVLGLQAVFEATIKTVKQLTAADFIAISLLEGDEHHIAIASGPKSRQFEGLTFPADDGMVGQAIKLRQWMPIDANYQEDFPVFSNSMRIAGLESLLVLPLLKGNHEAIGALTVAGRKPEMFPAERREIMEVIACQVATKIELGRAHEKICQMATTDGLTGLSNHRTFQNAFDNMLHRAQRHSTPLTVVLSDLDYFKKINDTYGHPFGDTVLQELGKMLAAATRKVDLAARYGGEEFALLLEESDIIGARRQVERVRCAINELKFYHNDTIIKISMSFGMAAFPEDGENKDDLIKKADQALYHAKAKGRNRCVSWSDTQQGG